MLISISTPLSISATHSEMTRDGVDVGQNPIQMGDASKLSGENDIAFYQPLTKADFESFLQQFQQLNQLQSDSEEGTEVIENEGFSDLLTDFNISLKTKPDAVFEYNLNVTNPLELTEQKDIVEADNESSIDEITADLAIVQQSVEVTDNELMSESSEIQVDPSEPVIAAAIPIDPVVQNAVKSGDKLPSSRQTVSAVKSAAELSTVDSDLAAKTNEASSISAKQLDDENSKLMNSIAVKSDEGKSALTEGDKIQIKQPVSEQTSVAIKETPASVLNQLNPVSTATNPGTANVSSATSLAALPNLHLSPQAAPSQWGQAIAERVSMAINKQLSSAEIRLDPPHLGKLDIHIQVKDDSATVMIHTQHAQTRDMIDSASIRLREFLQEAGYNSVNVDVSHREQTMAQGDFFQQGDNSQSGSDNSQQLSSQLENADNQQKIHYMNIDNGRIDFFA